MIGLHLLDAAIVMALALLGGLVLWLLSRWP